jgi:hypothetical protein
MGGVYNMDTAKLLVLMLTFNIFLYLGGVQLLDNDILDRFVNIDGEEVTGYSELGNSIPTDAEASTNNFVSDASGFSFFDALNIVWDALKFFLNLAFAPVGLIVSAGLPFVVQLALGIPLGIAYIFGIIVLVRGGGA